MGTWDSPVNADVSSTDSMFGNVATIGLTNSPVTLTVPPNAGSSWSGPYQSQSAILRFTGTLTGNVTITIPVTGFFIVENLCTVGSFYVALASSAPGQIICAPPGEACHVYCDGVNVKYVNLGRVGSYFDQAVAAVPAWISNCTVPPYLVCDGTVYTATAVYGVGNPAPLLNILGSTFGGNGITTFGTPDLGNRVRIPVSASGRVSSGVSGINGSLVGSGGGDQHSQSHTHANTLTDLGHTHPVLAQRTADIGQGVQIGGPQPNVLVGSIGQNGSADGNTGINSQAPMSINNVSSGAGNSQNMPPTLVSGMTFIKT